MARHVIEMSISTTMKYYITWNTSQNEVLIQYQNKKVVENTE